VFIPVYLCNVEIIVGVPMLKVVSGAFVIVMWSYGNWIYNYLRN